MNMLESLNDEQLENVEGGYAYAFLVTAALWVADNWNDIKAGFEQGMKNAQAQHG